MKIKKFLAPFFLFPLFWGVIGCSSAELEERNFPLAIAVDKSREGYRLSMGFPDLSQVADEKAKDSGSPPMQGEDKSLRGAFLDSDEGGPKSMDYNHVKALILSKEILDDKEALGEFLDYVKKQDAPARNTLLFTCEDKASDITDLEGKLNMAVGTYLEEIAGGSKEVKNVAVVTLGSLLNEYENQMENLFIPVIKVKEEKPVIGSYYILSSFQSPGSVNTSLYLLAMLLEGKLSRYEFELDSGEALILSNLKNQYAYTANGDAPKIEVAVSGEARLLNESIADEEEQADLKARTEEYLTERAMRDAAKLMEEKKVDITNSYYRLGGYNRSLYQAYGENQAAYKNNLEIRIRFEITPVQE